MKSIYRLMPERGAFRKYFFTKKAADHERAMYLRKLVIMPPLLGAGKEAALYYLDIALIECENIWQASSPDFARIASLYAYLHNAESKNGKSLCQMDTNPQNIIYDVENDRYYLIDFAEWDWQYPEYDLIHHLLFWAAASAQKDFSNIAETFLASYKAVNGIDASKWQQLFPQITQIFDDRRARYNKSEKTSGRDNEINRNLLKLVGN
jgi:aminoglycoside phosphotransferase (APT) family kinase protein